MLHPDGETVALFWGEAILGAVIVLVIVGVGALRKALFKPLA